MHWQVLRLIIWLDVVCLGISSCNASTLPTNVVLPRTITPTNMAEASGTAPNHSGTPLKVTPLDSHNNSGVALPFTTIAQSAASGGKVQEPYLRLAQTELQRAALAEQIDTLDDPKLNAVDLSSNVIIAAFDGLQPTSGYKIEIQAVEINGSELIVKVKRSSPAPGEPVRQGFESPYHLVEVARNDFENQQLVNYRMIDSSGEVLIEGTIKSLQ